MQPHHGERPRRAARKPQHLGADALNALGYTNRQLDGIFGGGTENAVRAFQRAVSLTADGICGCNTWKKLTAASVGIGRTRTVID